MNQGLLLPTGEFEQLLSWALGIVFGIFALRCVLGASLAMLSHLPGAVGNRCRTLSLRVTPKMMRRVAVVLIGTASATAAIGPAHAASQVEDLLIDRVPSYTETMNNKTPKTKANFKQVVVRDGDCLWSLAHDQLGKSASDSQITRQVARWYLLNKTTIGSDPNVIITGAVLKIPAVAR